MKSWFVNFLTALFFSLPFISNGQAYMTIKESFNVPSDSVFYLKISREKLTEIPSKVYSFKNLRGLDLSRNRLTVLSDSLEGLIMLETLNLSKNKFEIFPALLFKLKSLRVLRLASNHLGYIPDGISRCPRLEELDLYNNPIGDLGKGIFSLPTLLNLDLRGLMYNAKKQTYIQNQLEGVDILFDPPCKCID